jgi:hypothetical protein
MALYYFDKAFIWIAWSLMVILPVLAVLVLIKAKTNVVKASYIIFVVIYIYQQISHLIITENRL